MILVVIVNIFFFVHRAIGITASIKSTKVDNFHRLVSHLRYRIVFLGCKSLANDHHI